MSEPLRLTTIMGLNVLLRGSFTPIQNQRKNYKHWISEFVQTQHFQKCGWQYDWLQSHIFFEAANAFEASPA
jgi:hypothetical protein